MTVRLKYAVIFLLLVASFSKAGEFNLKINDLSGLDTPWPLLGSLAFPEGVLHDPSAIRITEKGAEVPSQVDVTATWRDGSIRWALAGFTASPQGTYTVEYGDGVKRGTHPRPLRVERFQDGSFNVDTGTAVYRFDNDKLLPQEAWLTKDAQRIQVLKDAGAGAYLVDNAGRTARVAGNKAEVENVFLKKGPGRVVVKRSGWYATGEGDRLAWADMWFYFAAGSPYVRMTHSLIFTEDTNKIWISDYGLEFQTPALPEDVYYSRAYHGKRDLTGEPAEEVKRVSTAGREIYVLQDTYPHFVERDYRAVAGSVSGVDDTVIEEFAVTGDWAHGDYRNYGITLVMPWLAQRFPKEISFGPQGARAVFWSGRSGRELDFRIETLVNEYWQSWPLGYRAVPPAVFDRHTNAQGAARTHDIWFLPHGGEYEADTVMKTATAASRPPLALADTEWLCKTEAIGYPMHYKDTTRFPAEEALIAEYWERFLLPLQAFPMKGFIAWGCYPSRGYETRRVGLMARMNTLESLREYGVRREPWRHYARSGERIYYDYGHRFSRFTGDWHLAHRDAPDKKRGGFIRGQIFRDGAYFSRLPLFWGGSTHQFSVNAGDIGHWLLDYYLTGDERSFELLGMIKKSFADNNWSTPHTHPRNLLKVLTTLAVMDWDENALDTAANIARVLIDMESPSGANTIYKDHRISHNLSEYYLQTGDELAGNALIKLLDYRYRFDRRYRAVAHKNYDAFTHTVAYRKTRDERFRRVVEQTLSDALYYGNRLPLSADIAKKPDNILEWTSLHAPVKALPGVERVIFLRQSAFQSPFIGLPTALYLLAEKGTSGKRTPAVIKSLDLNNAKLLFRHTLGQDTVISLYFTGVRSDIAPELFMYPLNAGDKAIDGIRTEIEERIPWPESLAIRPDDIYHAFVTVPAEIPGGLYLLTLGDDEPFTVLDITGDEAALYCPEGFWSASRTPIRRRGEGDYGRAGEGIPMFFRVPEGLDELRIFVGRPALVKRPDGSAAVNISNENIGELSVPVEGNSGIWSIEPYLRSFAGDTPPAFFKLLNVEPVVAFGSPALLPEGTMGEPVPAARDIPPAPETPYGFVQGLAGRALHLSDGKTLSFPAGEAVEQGGYTYFPGKKGTVEFWFRPGRATHETPMEMNGIVDWSFIRAGHVRLLHRYEVDISYLEVGGNLRLEMFSQGAATASAGFQGEHFFKAGEWYHIAYTWDISDMESGEAELNVFLNGRRLAPSTRAYSRLGPLSALRGLTLPGEGGHVEIGPFNGTIDILRISDVVRYRQDFVPSKTVPVTATDGRTRVLFLFDGNLRGASAFSPAPVEAQ